MRIIPAIDIIDGKCVRLEKGDFSKKKIYADNPVEMAKSFEDHGLQYLHLVDLDGAKAGKIINFKVLENIKSTTSLIVDFGGGIRSVKDVRNLIDAGADQVNIGSLSVKKPEVIDEMLMYFSPDVLVLSPDVIQRKIAIHGWQESSEMDLLDYISNFLSKGISHFVCTDIEKDGMLSGSSIDLYQEVMETFENIRLIASGGVTDLNELDRLFEIGIDGVIIGKAIYEGRISLKNLSAYAG